MKQDFSGQVVDLVDLAFQLASYFKSDPRGVEQDLLQAGDRLLAIFDNEDFGSRLKGLTPLKEECIELAIQDISNGFKILSNQTLGVYFNGSIPLLYQLPFGDSPQGTNLFSIALKDRKAFQGWRAGSTLELTQDEVNCAIYRLAFSLSELR